MPKECRIVHRCKERLMAEHPHTGTRTHSFLTCTHSPTRSLTHKLLNLLLLSKWKKTSWSGLLLYSRRFKRENLEDTFWLQLGRRESLLNIMMVLKLRARSALGHDKDDKHQYRRC